MSSAVRVFSVGCNPINKSNVFTSGDYLTGQITLELANDCKIDSISVKLKGKANVRWLQSYGRIVVMYRAKEKYFSIKQFIIQEGHGSNNVAKGCHVYPFTFQIPAQDTPSSFKGNSGKIRYTLEANLSRSMRSDSKAKARFTFIQKANTNSVPMLMNPQHGITEKKMKLFNSGTVAMDVNIEGTSFHQGEGIKVVAFIHNKSSREIKPKYCLYEKHSYFAQGKRKVEIKDLLKEVGEPIPPAVVQTVTRIITIPPTTTASILNCDIIKAECRLRVYLDIKYAVDPEVKFPIVVLPAPQTPDVDQPPVYSRFAFEAFGNPNITAGTNYLQNRTTSGPSAAPPSYETAAIYPSSGFDGKSSYFKS